MSLVKSLMNGGYQVQSYINPSNYTHNTGALRIDIESTEELHDIFLESYNYEQAELAAVGEGLDLWESNYSVVAEGSIATGIEKIKEFFKNLWAKIKAFIKNVIMHIQSMFMSAQGFVKKYKDAINNANNNLKDFEFKTYKYDDKRINDMQGIDSFNADDFGKKLIDNVSQFLGDNTNFFKDKVSESYYYSMVNEALSEDELANYTRMSEKEFADYMAYKICGHPDNVNSNKSNPMSDDRLIQLFKRQYTRTNKDIEKMIREKNLSGQKFADEPKGGFKSYLDRCKFYINGGENHTIMRSKEDIEYDEQEAKRNKENGSNQAKQEEPKKQEDSQAKQVKQEEPKKQETTNPTPAPTPTKTPKTLEDMLETSKDLKDGDKVAVRVANILKISGVKDKEGFDEACFSVFRGGAANKDQVDVISITSLTPYVEAINNSNLSKVNSYSTKVDNVYKSLINSVNKAISELNKSNSSGLTNGGKNNVSTSVEILRNCSSGISLYQSCHNTYFKHWKDVISERDKTYKNLLLAGISNAGKKKK